MRSNEMRSARTLIGTVLALALLGLPGAASAQSSEEPQSADNQTAEPVFVTWSGPFQSFLDVPGEQEYFPWGIRGYAGVRAALISDDPRISGRVTDLYFGDGPLRHTGQPSRWTKLRRIENVDGAWQGPHTEVHFPDGTWVDYGWLEGEGAYEGLSFFTSWRGPWSSSTRKGEGMIWPGDPPPAPDPALMEALLED
jgi:hypothetical protein